MTISAIIRAVRDRLQFEDHAALVGSSVAIGVELLSLTQPGDAAADTAAVGAALLSVTIVAWLAAKVTRR